MGGSGGGYSGFGGRGSSGSPAGGDAGGSGGRGDGRDHDFDCNGYEATVTLKSPKSHVVSKLEEDEELEVALTSGKAPIVAKKDGQVAGSIVVQEQEKLVECMRGGTRYLAKVRSVKGGSCVVDIYAE